MSVTYVNKKGEYVEVSPCFTRIRDLELPDLNATHPNELKNSIKSLLTNPITIPPVIYNPFLENFKIKEELVSLEERVNKLENAFKNKASTTGWNGKLVTVSNGKFIEVSPYLGKFDDLGLTCPPPVSKSRETKN